MSIESIIADSYVINTPIIPNGVSFNIPDHSEFKSWPSGTVEGDLIVLQTEYGWTGLPPSGWLVHYNVSSTAGSGALYSKVMSAADISAGGVLLTATGNFDFPGSGNLIRIPGTGAAETLVNAGGTGVMSIGVSPSNVEQIVSNCDLDLTQATSVVQAYFELWWSMNEGGGGKAITWRIRRDNLSGAILASGGGGGATADTSSGHNVFCNGGVVDTAPTTGRYVLTVQCTGGFSSPIYSDYRYFRVIGKAPAVRTFTGGYVGGSGFTSLGITSPAALAAGEKVLWMVSARVDATFGLNRATVIGGAHGADGSAGAWWEDSTATGTLSGTMTASASGSNYLAQAVMVSLP